MPVQEVAQHEGGAKVIDDRITSPDADFELRVNGIMLSELPLNRAAEYLKLLGLMLGTPKETRLVSLVNGSLSASVKMSPNAKSIAYGRLAVEAKQKNTPAWGAFEKLNRAIANDGGDGKILDLSTGCVILEFPGARSVHPSSQSFFEETKIRGKLCQFGEKVDGRYTGQIRDAKNTYTFTCDEAIAHPMSVKLFHPVEICGRANWQRQPDGKWRLISFYAGSFRELRKSRLSEVRALIHQSGGLGTDSEDAQSIMKGLR